MPFCTGIPLYQVHLWTGSGAGFCHGSSSRGRTKVTPKHLGLFTSAKAWENHNKQDLKQSQNYLTHERFHNKHARGAGARAQHQHQHQTKQTRLWLVITGHARAFLTLSIWPFVFLSFFFLLPWTVVTVCKVYFKSGWMWLTDLFKSRRRNSSTSANGNHARAPDRAAD